MKTIGKLKINAEKTLKADDLIRLRGGYELSCDIYMAYYNWGTYLGLETDTWEICNAYEAQYYPQYPNSYCANCTVV